MPDWSRETPRTTRLPVVAPDVSADAWIEHVRTLSAALARPELTRSDVSVTLTQGTRYSVNSEGFTTVAPIQSAQLRLSAETQADDGMPLRDSVTAHARTLAGLPAPADLAVRARELAAGLVALRTAPVGEAYTGPVLVEGQASAELLAQTLVPLFLTLRAPEMENPQMFGPMGNAPPTPFLTRVGNRVLPESFTASDTPSLAQFEGREVAGAYAVDDEGVPAQDVTLCEKGLLKSLLTSRTPQKGFLVSNGHGRGGVATAGVFQLQSSAAVPAASLKEKYLARLKADGLAVRLHRPRGRSRRTEPVGRPRGLHDDELDDARRRQAARAGHPARLPRDGGRRRDAGPRSAVRQRAARRVPRHPGGLERAQSLQLPLVAAAGDAADVDAAGRRRRRRANRWSR